MERPAAMREDDEDKMEEKLQEDGGRSHCRTSRSQVTSPEMALVLACFLLALLVSR